MLPRSPADSFARTAASLRERAGQLCALRSALLIALLCLPACGEDPEGDSGQIDASITATTTSTTTAAIENSGHGTAGPSDLGGGTMVPAGASDVLAPLPPASGPRLAEPPGPGPWFEIAEPADTGLSHRNLSGPLPSVGKLFLRDTIGQGIAVFDADGDGQLDLYFPQGQDGTDHGGDSGNRLYLAAQSSNEGGTQDSQWTERGAAFGVDDPSYSFGALAFDYDNDGDEDLLVTNLGPNRLLRNDGGSFTDVTEQHPGLAGDGDFWSTGASAGDVDGDGDLDLYVANYVEQDIAALEAKGQCMFMGCRVPCGPNGLRPQPDRFYRNSGAPHYKLVDASSDSGFANVETSYGFQPTFLDLDDDGDLDLYVTNDSVFNFLFINDGTGHFTEEALLAGAACGRMGQLEAGMGLATGHPNGDGLPHLYVTNFSNQSNSYYSNKTSTPDEPWFDEISELAGCGRPTWFRLAWGTSFGDFDSDGLLDIFSANGHIYHHVTGCAPDRIVYEEQNDMFRGTDGGFVDWATRSGPAFASSASHRGSVTLDMDRDGDLDLVINRLDDLPLVALNSSPEAGHWLGLEVRRRDNPDGPTRLAVGARVIVKTESREFSRDVIAGSSFLSSESPRLHFGLGETTTITDLTVRLPGHPARSFEGPMKALSADHLHTLVVEADGSLSVIP